MGQRGGITAFPRASHMIRMLWEGLLLQQLRHIPNVEWKRVSFWSFLSASPVSGAPSWILSPPPPSLPCHWFCFLFPCYLEDASSNRVAFMTTCLLIPCTNIALSQPLFLRIPSYNRETLAGWYFSLHVLPPISNTMDPSLNFPASQTRTSNREICSWD